MDGVHDDGDSDFDDEDEDTEVVEPYSVDTPMRAPLSVATPLSARLSGSVGAQPPSSSANGAPPSAVAATPGVEDSDDDDADMVVATPGIGSSMLTPNPASVATIATTPATPSTKRILSASGGAGSSALGGHPSKKPRGGSGAVGHFRDIDEEDLADEDVDDLDADDDEDEFGSVATMTPAGQRYVFLCFAKRTRLEWSDDSWLVNGTYYQVLMKMCTPKTLCISDNSP